MNIRRRKEIVDDNETFPPYFIGYIFENHIIINY